MWHLHCGYSYIVIEPITRCCPQLDQPHLRQGRGWREGKHCPSSRGGRASGRGGAPLSARLHHDDERALHPASWFALQQPCARSKCSQSFTCNAKPTDNTCHMVPIVNAFATKLQIGTPISNFANERVNWHKPKWFLAVSYAHPIIFMNQVIKKSKFLAPWCP